MYNILITQLKRQTVQLENRQKTRREFNQRYRYDKESICQDV